MLKDVYPPALEGILPSRYAKATVPKPNGKYPIPPCPTWFMPVSGAMTPRWVNTNLITAWKRNSQALPRHRSAMGYLEGHAVRGFPGADIYRSAAVGIGKSLNQWGAISADYTFRLPVSQGVQRRTPAAWRVCVTPRLSRPGSLPSA